MKALSLWQPWASLIALGVKRIETRSWATAYRGPIAIHAAQRVAIGRGQKITTGLYWTENDGSGLLLRGPGIWPYRLPLGAIVATANLVACEVMTDALIDLVPDPERAAGNYAPGRWMWMLEDVRPIRFPVACVGRQGLWNAPLSIAAAHGTDAKAEVQP